MDADSPTPFVPEPALLAAVLVPYLVLVPYSKYQFVATPLGLTVPPSFADVKVIELTEPVTAAGALVVEKVLSALRLVPASRVPTSRKWKVRPLARPVRGALTATEAEPAP